MAMGSIMTFPHLHVIYLDKVLSHVVETSQRFNFLLHKREDHILHLEYPSECRRNWAVHRGWRQDPHNMLGNQGTKINVLWVQVRDSASIYEVEDTLRNACYQSPSHTCTHIHKYTDVWTCIHTCTKCEEI